MLVDILRGKVNSNQCFSLTRERMNWPGLKNVVTDSVAEYVEKGDPIRRKEIDNAINQLIEEKVSPLGGVDYYTTKTSNPRLYSDKRIKITKNQPSNFYYIFSSNKSLPTKE